MMSSLSGYDVADLEAVTLRGGEVVPLRDGVRVFRVPVRGGGMVEVSFQKLGGSERGLVKGEPGNAEVFEAVEELQRSEGWGNE